MRDKRRGERRDRTWRYSARAQRIHLRSVHRRGAVDCICEQSVWYFRKGKAGGCRCRAKRKGAPKLAGGMCSTADQGHYRRTTHLRIRGKRLAHAWLSYVGATDLDEVDL